MLSWEATYTNFIDFGFAQPGFEPTIYRIEDEHDQHNTTNVVTALKMSMLTDVVTTLKMSMPTITPPMWLPHWRWAFPPLHHRCGYHTEDEHAHHYTTDVVTTLKMSMPTITPPMWLPHWRWACSPLHHRCGYHTEDEHAHHYTTDVVTTLKMSMPTITPPMWFKTKGNNDNKTFNLIIFYQ